MNYCCAMGNCAACVKRYARIRMLAKNSARRLRFLRRYGAPPPSKQDVFATVDVRIIDEEQYQRMWYLQKQRQQ